MPYYLIKRPGESNVDVIMAGKGRGSKWSWPYSRQYAGVWFEEISNDNPCPDRVSKHHFLSTRQKR
jgi:hypothetical protein